MDLLFTMAHWHGLAKLRMHNDLTIELMDAETASLGVKLRAFSRHTCPAFATRELQREYNARLQREAKSKSASRNSQTATSNATSNASAISATQASSSSEATRPIAEQPQTPTTMGVRSKRAGRRTKTLNINTYKFHAYGDYPATIRRYGTMDSYSSETVCDS